MFQRSCDTPVGLPANLAQYAALMLALCQVTGHKPGEYIHSFSDAHIFIDQVDKVKELISRPTKPLPTMKIINKKDDIFAYRPDDFELQNYDPHPGIWNIPVAI